MHTLDITYQDTFNCKTLRIANNSVYDKTGEIYNTILEIKPPGAECYVSFKYSKNWKYEIFNSSLLKISCTDCADKLAILPDGIYGIKFSVAPNEQTMVEFDHMRVCQIMKEYMTAVCKFLSTKCDLSKSKVVEIEKKLVDIERKIRWSVYKVEECLEPVEGLKLYNDVKEELKQFNDTNGKGCSFCN